jgi:hypothetical protein
MDICTEPCPDIPQRVIIDANWPQGKTHVLIESDLGSPLGRPAGISRGQIKQLSAVPPRPVSDWL